MPSTRPSASCGVAASGFSTSAATPRTDGGEPEREVGRRRGGDDDGIEVVVRQHRLRLVVALGVGRSRAPPRASRRADPRSPRARRPRGRSAAAGGCDPSPRARSTRRAPGARRWAPAAAHRSAVAACRPTTARTASMTVAWSSSVRPGNIGSERLRAAARSVTGRSAWMPSARTYGWRWTGIG